MKTSLIAGQSSWQLAPDKMTAAVTEQGRHLAPVRFRVGRRVVEPFSVVPWTEEPPGPDTPSLLRVSRADFFCAPFGGTAEIRRKQRREPQRIHDFGQTSEKDGLSLLSPSRQAGHTPVDIHFLHATSDETQRN